MRKTDKLEEEHFNTAISTNRSNEEREIVYKMLATSLLVHPYIRDKGTHDAPVMLYKSREAS